ncbi:AIPR family protein [Streptomyces buecherae]|uniref:AIPR family protein n=1 Tax=Streptomyces buecherae TaxID=2763006 RepID=UPI003696CE9F
MTDSLEVALQKRLDLDTYGSNKRLLFALQLAFGIEDIHSIAATALTDSSNDKACDLLYIDRDGERVTIAQGYEAQNLNRLQAPSSKAAALHQAVNWLFSKKQPTGVPETLLGAWRELHDALGSNAISEVEVWYVHNLPESQQVAQELNVASEAAFNLLRQGYPENEISVSGTELGRTVLTRRYENSQAPILVTETFRIEIPGAFEERGTKWTALCTSVPIRWLYDRYRQHEADLFSPNVRDYLGSSRSKSNINNGIQETVRKQPTNVWAYNNGITALVHDFRIIDGNLLEITGLGIVNGAQTTGAIGSVPPEEIGADSHVLARFIRCDDPETVRSIVRFNNRQNPTRAADFRSNDAIQRRLVAEFNQLGVIGYNGGRRGGAEDVIRRPGENQLSAEAAAQALAAFHGSSHTAYHEKSKIWEQDEIYSRIFPERVTAEHIVFVTSLMRAIETEKSKLSRIDTAEMLQDQVDLFDWLSLRGSIVLAVEAIGAVHETLIGTAVANPHALQFKKKLNMPKAVQAWEPVVESLLAFAPDQLREPLVTSSPLRNRTAVDKAVKSFRAQVNSARKHSKDTFETFAQHVRH